MRCPHRIKRIWVELEEYADGPSARGFDDEYCNAAIDFEDGARVGLVVWSEQLLRAKVGQLEWYDDAGAAMLPDVVVREFSLAAIRTALESLVTSHDWLTGRGFPARTED